MKFPLLAKVAQAIVKAGILSPVDNRGGWYPWIKEPYSGAWQKNDEWCVASVLAYPAVYACITQISNDIGKLRSRLMELGTDGIWSETTSAAFSPVLKRPNRYQNQIQFKQWWLVSKLCWGNAYVLKQRDQRGIVVAMYLLDPQRVQVLVTEDGGVYYQLSQDNLAGGKLTQVSITVPASEIIHDRMNCLFHPLVGISPLFSSGIAATLGLKMLSDSLLFFSNGANPGGVLTAPGAISAETAAELKAGWTANYTGANAGKVAVLGDGLKYEPMRMSAREAQTTEQSKRLDELICATFHIPPWIVGLGTMPAGMKPGDLKQIYYDNCLHSLIEEMEACLDDGLALPVDYGVELDLATLLRMDQATQISTLAAGVAGSIMTINDARKPLNLKPLDGGDTVYMQQQDFPLQVVKDNVLPDANPEPEPDPDPAPEDDEEIAAEETRALIDHIRKGLQCA